MRLGPKLRMSYVGIVLVAITIVLTMVIYNARRELKEKIGEDLQYVAKIEAGNIDEYIKKKIYEIRILSKDSLFSSNDTSGMTAYLGKLKNENIGFDMLSVINPEGKIIASTDQRFAGKYFKARDDELNGFLERAVQSKSGDIFFKYGYGGKRENELKAFIFTPMTDKSKADVISVMMAVVNMNRLLRDTGRFEGHTFLGKTAFLADNRATMIVTQEGKAQTFTPLVYIQNSNSPLLKFVKKGNAGYTIYKDPERGKTIMGYASLNWHGEAKSHPWLVISLAPEREVFSPAVRLRNDMIVLGIIALFIAWILSFFVAKGITKPIRKLVSVTYLISKGDLSQRADIKRDDEVGDLAKSFNKMTDKLSSAIADRDQDLIERKNIEEKLREEMDAKSKFISMISYEFRTPLTAIKEGVDTVLKEASGKIDDKHKRLLDLARRSGQNLSHLVKDIIDFHKLETDKAVFDIKENDINEAVSEVQNNMIPLLAEKKEVSLIAKLDKDIPKIGFDKEKIILALTNIVNVTIKSAKKGDITITTSKEGENTILVSIKDPHTVIAEEVLPKLFYQFNEHGGFKDKEAGG